MDFSETESVRDEEIKRLITGTSYIITYKRWIVLTTVSVTLFLSFFSFSIFGFINDTTTEYFKVTPAQTDLLSTLGQISRLFVGFSLALMAKKLNLTSILSIATMIVVVAEVLIVVGVSGRSNFVVAVFGQVLNGAGTTMTISLTQMTPANWFPKNERGKAVSVPYIFIRLSQILSNIVATRTLKATSQNTPLTNITEDYIRDQILLITSFRDSFQIAFSVLGLCGFVCFLLTIFYVTDYPRTVDNTQGAPTAHEPFHIASEVRESLAIFVSKRYLIILVLVVAIFSASPILSWMLSSVVLKAFPELDDSIVGTMFCVGYAAAAFGPPVGGALLDRFKRPKLTYALGMTIFMLAFGMMSLSIYFHSFKFVFACFLALSLLRDFCFICITHCTVELLQEENSTTKIRGFSISASLPAVSLVAYTSLTRFVVEIGNPYIAALIPIPFHLIALVLYLCVY